MKDITFSLNLGLIGSEYSRLEIFIDHLKEIASKYTSDNLVHEFFLHHEGTPIKLRIAIAREFDDLIQRSDNFSLFDALIIVVNLYDGNSISDYTIQKYSDFRNYYIFNGISVLVGVDTFLMFQKEPPNKKDITEFNLIQKTKELEFLYCFKVQDENKDIPELFDKVLNYINQKLKFLNPELFKRANSNREILNERV